MVEKSCELFERCKEVLNSIQIPPKYLNPPSHKCYCLNCYKDKEMYTRGDSPYIMPINSCRFGLKLDARKDWEDIFQTYQNSYHGTHYKKVKLIVLNGLLMPGDKIPEKDINTPGYHIPNQKYIFTSPSIKYALHDTYAKSHEHNNCEYKFILQLRQKPGTFIKGKETMGYGEKVIDKYVENNVIEWKTELRGTIELIGIIVHEVNVNEGEVVYDKSTDIMDLLYEESKEDYVNEGEVVFDKRTDIMGLFYEESKEDYGLSSYVEKPRMDIEKIRDHDSSRLETHDSTHSRDSHDIHRRHSSRDKHRRHGSHDKHATHGTKHHTTDGTSNTLKLPHQEYYWEKVVIHLKALRKGPKISDIIKDMKEINNIVSNKSGDSFSLLNKYCDNMVDQDKITFQKVIIPRLAEYALDLPTTFRGTDHEKGLKILEEETTGYVAFDKVQVATLQACLFFGLFHPHHWKGLHKDLNYTALFNDIGIDDMCQSKIKCLITGYFCSLTRHKSMDKGEFMTIKRVSKALSSLGNSYTAFWNQSEIQLINLHVHSSGSIETRVKGSELVCFANKHFGRHVMEGKAEPEDLLFLSIPELYLCRLVCPALSDEEAIQVSGVRRILEISRTKGQITFKEAHGKPLTCVTGIDADNYSQDRDQQFSEYKILGELWKAVIGFEKDPINLDRNEQYICTGNWGCGINGGDLQLKFLIQWLAASQAGRTGIHYYTSGAKELDKADVVVRKLGTCSVGQIFQLLNYYITNVHGKEHITLFDFCIAQ